ncbi:hypothetical protein WJX73_001381 [Symbiochloris irregularis]|uniref:Uncharacterized protein n=1 Tax=Symbiochloris irregularis TaxID=706552 RepID=A0AAW1PII0_9CHLO
MVQWRKSPSILIFLLLATLAGQKAAAFNLIGAGPASGPGPAPAPAPSAPESLPLPSYLYRDGGNNYNNNNAQPYINPVTTYQTTPTTPANQQGDTSLAVVQVIITITGTQASLDNLASNPSAQAAFAAAIAQTLQIPVSRVSIVSVQVQLISALNLGRRLLDTSASTPRTAAVTANVEVPDGQQQQTVTLLTEAADSGGRLQANTAAQGLPSDWTYGVAPSSNQATTKSSSGGLSGGAIAGIVIAVVLVLGFVIGCELNCRRIRKRDGTRAHLIDGSPR